jgi:hypothetical protein
MVKPINTGWRGSDGSAMIGVLNLLIIILLMITGYSVIIKSLVTVDEQVTIIQQQSAVLLPVIYDIKQRIGKLKDEDCIELQAISYCYVNEEPLITITVDQLLTHTLEVSYDELTNQIIELMIVVDK